MWVYNKILTHLPKILPLKEVSSDAAKLDKLVSNSEKVMEEFGELFKSKTLEELYTPEYKYNGGLPQRTLIKDKYTGEPTEVFIQHAEYKSDTLPNITEEYNAITVSTSDIPECDEKSVYLGYKNFDIIKNKKTSRIDVGYMKSERTDRYAGTQIRLTQVEVERAMQEHINTIPLYSLAEALPFHTMMGFRPKESLTKVVSVEEVERELDSLARSNESIDKKHFVPIVHKKNDQYYFDKNQTRTNALLRYLKELGCIPNSEVDCEGIEMELRGKELEAWKQRAISQPIFLKKQKSIKS